jgi:hypothetical protein
MKLQIDEKDETQTYRPAPIQQILEMVKVNGDVITIYVPNACGGETRITLYESTCPKGNEEFNMPVLKANKP